VPTVPELTLGPQTLRIQFGGSNTGKLLVKVGA
jgi:hypothetical protein